MHLSITDSDSSERVINAICSRFGYNDTVEDEDGQEIDNPVSKEEFAHDRVCRWVTSQVMKYESSQAVRDAELAARESIGDLDLGS